jgi:lysophospholipase L1-like esterase
MQKETEQLIRSSLRGVAEVTNTERGLTFNRLPEWTFAHHSHDPLTNQVARHGSGVRLLLQTNATEITLTYRSTRDMPERPAVVTLAANGTEVSIEHANGNHRLWNSDGSITFVAGEDSVAFFELPEADSAREVSIWLPHNCAVELIDLTANAPLHPGSLSKRTWLNYGSSISHAIEADEPLGVWSSRVAQDLELDLFNLGLAGSANAEYFVAKTIAETPANLITLKLGINVVAGATMTKRTFVAAVQAMLDIIREKQPSTRIVVISPLYSPGFENQPGPARTDSQGQVYGSTFSDVDWVGELTLSAIREILRGLVESRADQNLSYLNGLELFGEADVELMPDHLHPNAEGYLLIADRVKKLLFSELES